MKKIAAALLSLCLLVTSAACAEPERSTTADGMTYYGMLTSGAPSGFVAVETAGGERVSFGIMDAGSWQGSLYTIVKDENGMPLRLMVATYQGGACTTSLHCMQDGTLTLFTYQDGEIISSLVRSGDTATAYTITDGVASAPQGVSIKSLEGGAMYPQRVMLATETDDEGGVLYLVQDHTGAPYIAVYAHGDGSVEIMRYFDQHGTYYNAADNTCIVGRMANDEWADGAILINSDGSAVPLGY